MRRLLNPGNGLERLGRLPEPDEVELLESEGFPGLLRTGRWFMAFIQIAIVLFIFFWNPYRSIGTYLAMALMLFYNAAVLWILHHQDVNRLPVRLALTLDLLVLAHITYWTGGIESPFLGQAYLVVFAAALFYNARGGTVAGLAAALFSLAFAFTSKLPQRWEIFRDTAPYFVIVGGYTGFLVGRTKMWFARYRETFERELERERETNLRERNRERQERQREREEADRQRIEEVRDRDLALARDIQRSSIPLVPPTMPGLRIAVVSEPSGEVGGDFHLFVTEPDEGRLGIVVGDVSGKGIGAALVATSIGYVLPHLRPLEKAHAALQALNRDLVQRLPETAFASTLYAEMNPVAATMTVWNAGHPAALLWRARGGAVVETPTGEAPPLGMFDHWSAPARRFDFFSGDTLLICSDGVLEARSADGEVFGERRLREIFAQLAPSGPDSVAVGVVDAAREFGTTHDDLTVIVCQRLGNPATF